MSHRRHEARALESSRTTTKVSLASEQRHSGMPFFQLASIGGVAAP
jgi:hypothetical protein